MSTYFSDAAMSVHKSPISIEVPTTMRIIEVSGSARQIGLATGEALREDIKQHLAVLAKKPKSRHWNKQKSIVAKTLLNSAPQSLDELRAIAEAANVPFDELLYLNTEGLSESVEDRCTNIAFAAGPNGPIWGKNNDRGAKEFPIPVCARVIHRVGLLPVVIFTYAGMLATGDGMNSVGLSVGHSSVGSIFEPSDSHVPIRIWFYEGLMRCRTTAQFISHMTARPMRGKGYAFLCVDEQGHTASLEAPCPLIQVRQSRNSHGHMHCVNIYQLAALAQADRRSPAGRCNANERMKWLDERLDAAEKTDLNEMRAILSKTDQPAICRNGTAPDTAVTEYSMIALPKQRRAMFLYGKPTEQAYQSFTFTKSQAMNHWGVVNNVNKQVVDPAKLREAIDRGCAWIQDIAQIKTDVLPPKTHDRKESAYRCWRGAIRGEYTLTDRLWFLFGPIWHTGQAVKALVMAAEALDQPRYMDGARAGADFVFGNQVWDPSDANHGLILAFEDIADQVNTSAILETMDGLMMLAEAENSDNLWERIITAGSFLLDRLFVPELGLFRDLYIPAEARVGSTTRYRSKDTIGGRPLLDDGILLKLYKRTGEDRFLDAHVKISERLLADQNPPGNWIDYGPCNVNTGTFHPRHTYWWGMPLIDTYLQTGREEFLQTAIASGEFCLKAMRRDGGYMRGTYADFNTESFGHATSGSACVAILFLRLFEQTAEQVWLDAASTAISFCMRMQFQNTQDPNLQGAILEKILPPDGSERSPYYVRDLGTIFFVIAGVEYLQTIKMKE